MPRQQKRAIARSAAKAKTRKVRKVLKPDPADTLGAPLTFKAEDLDDRRTRGLLLFEAMGRGTADRTQITDDESYYWSSREKDRCYRTKRELRNVRNKMQPVYRCTCPDFKKDGRNGCEHIFAERLERKEVIVVGNVSAARARTAKAVRRPARKRKTASGESIKTTQRKARVKMPSETPRLITSLRHQFDRQERASRMERHGVLFVPKRKRGGQPVPGQIRATALIHKIARRKSADEMVFYFSQLIRDRHLLLERAPHQNSLSNWMNDESLTFILRELLRLTALPFRRREVAAIIDSTKMSQMSTAHHRGTQYLGDDRPDADWMRCHVITGVETNVVMAVEFAGVYGDGTADVNFLKPLVTEARKTFPLAFLLADKGYVGEDYVRWLWHECHMRAYIPVKKNILKRERTEFFDPVVEDIIMFDEHPKEVHEVYRLRSKIEGFFSVLKRIASDYCWSHGRPREGSNDLGPSTAWINETLCKFIYMNLRTTVTLQEETGYEIDYTVADRFFPPPIEPLIAA